MAPLLAKLFGMQHPPDCKVADLGRPSEFYHHPELGWVIKGQEHLAKKPEPVPPPPQRSTEASDHHTPQRKEARSGLDDMLAPPRLHFQSKRDSTVKSSLVLDKQKKDPISSPALKHSQPLVASPKIRHQYRHTDENASSELENETLQVTTNNVAVSDASRREGLLDLCKENAQVRRRLTDARRCCTAQHACREAQKLCQNMIATCGPSCQLEEEAVVSGDVNVECCTQNQKLEMPMQREFVHLWAATVDQQFADQSLQNGCLEQVLLSMQKFEACIDMQIVALGILINIAKRPNHCMAIARAGWVHTITSALLNNSASNFLLQMGCQALYVLALPIEVRPLIVQANGREVARLAASREEVQLWGWHLEEILDF